MTIPAFPIRSDLSGAAWPAVPNQAGALALAMQYQLEQSQWWPLARIEEYQLNQLGNVLRHAHATIPFWRERLEAARFDPAVTPAREWLRALPTLTRAVSARFLPTR